MQNISNNVLIFYVDLQCITGITYKQLNVKLNPYFCIRPLYTGLMVVDGKHYQSVWVEKNHIVIINQQKLPFEFELLQLSNVEEVIEAISSLKVRGAPAIGITAAYAIWLSYKNHGRLMKDEYDKLVSCRPTAVNLKRGADFVFVPASGGKMNEKQIFSLADEFARNEIDACKKIGENGFSIIQQLYEKLQQPINILTHCNAGWLACGDYGTALSPIFEANRKGIPIHVWVDETRPLNQGSRLTAWELSNENIPFHIISDNSGALLMMQNKVDAVITGADRIVSNGDVANKIGTYQKALAAKEHKIPFWVAAPLTTFDFKTKSGAEIKIEERHGNELQLVSGKNLKSELIVDIKLFPDQFPSLNHAFDITPAKFVSKYITEIGIFSKIEQVYEKRNHG